ncbi:MAG TPA: energy transducer TonB [Pyrinomonadaceae bacterium]|nr:energy transducer TonB [Pyrinomonadaceae bacterium]
MNGIEPRDQFTSKDELRKLLESWIAPEAPKSLDNKVTHSYAREIANAHLQADSALLSQKQKEVVAMKFCSTCQEEFAEKFSFCPVDGTPLSAAVARIEEPSVTAATNASEITQAPVQPPTQRPPVHQAAVAGGGSMGFVPRGEYHLTIMDDAGLAQRLTHEIRDVAHEYELTWPEFKRDPFGFTKRTFVGYGQMAGRFLGNRNVLISMAAAVFAMLGLVAAVAIVDRSHSSVTSHVALVVFAMIASTLLIALFATWMGRERGSAVMGAEPSDSRNVLFAMSSAFVFLFAVIGGVMWFDHRHKQDLLAQENAEELQVEQVFDIPQDQPTPEPGNAGFNKGSGGGSKPKQERPGGGGGGGRQETTPASAGKLPQASLTVPQILPPDPKPPTIKNPALPVAATVVADPLLVPPDARLAAYGDPKSKSTTPSSGPGTGNGIGNGTGTGVGPGEGGGVGPGRGGNIGGGDRNDGGGGAGGGGGGDPNRIFSGREVTQKARVLSKPEPQYTEEARKNQITGTVVLRAVFTSNGAVSNIRAVSGLPYGLTERAIAAARLIKFSPALKDGRPVSMYIQLEYNFNLY